MQIVQRATTALALAVAGATLAACTTTQVATVTPPQGVAVQLTETQFELVKASIRELLWEPTGAYFTPNVGAVQVGNTIAVCGILNGSNPYAYVSDALYVVYLHLAGGLRAEVLDIGGPSDANRDIRNFCIQEFGISLAE